MPQNIEDQNIPEGIKAFKNPLSDIIDWEGYKTWNSTYEKWVHTAIKIGWPIHTIEVDGKQWSVGDNCRNYGIIESFQWREDSHGEDWFWYAHTKSAIVMVKNLISQTPSDPLLMDGKTATL